ncbi:MAG: ParA family protein [Butyricicoccaceae bacterium]
MGRYHRHKRQSCAGARKLSLIAMDHRERSSSSSLDAKVRTNTIMCSRLAAGQLGLLTLNYCAADSFWFPLQCEYYALEGLSQLTTRAHGQKHEPSDKPGLPLTMFDGRTNLSIQVVEDKGTGRGILVGRSAQLRDEARAAASRSPVRPYCRGAEAYLSLRMNPAKSRKERLMASVKKVGGGLSQYWRYGSR